MNIINIRESLLDIDRKTYCKYDLTTLYEACNLDEDGKKKLVQYIASYEHPSVIGKFLETGAGPMMEAVADDLTDAETTKVIDDINDGTERTLWNLLDKADEEDSKLQEDVNWRTEPRNSKEVSRYVYRKISPYDELTDDDSRYWDFDRGVVEGDDAKLVKSAPTDARYVFSLVNGEVDIDLYLGQSREGDCWFVVDHNGEADAIPEALEDREPSYEDKSGILGNPGARYTMSQLDDIWEQGKDSDPSMMEYKGNRNAWFRDTLMHLDEGCCEEPLDEQWSEKDVEFNDRYFPRVDINDKSRYDYVQHKGKDFAYDKKRNVLIYLFRDDEEVEHMGDEAPWRELDGAGLRAENWNDEEMRAQYLDDYCYDLDTESSYLAQDFIQNELPYYQNQDNSVEEGIIGDVIKVGKAAAKEVGKKIANTDFYQKGIKPGVDAWKEIGKEVKDRVANSEAGKRVIDTAKNTGTYRRAQSAKTVRQFKNDISKAKTTADINDILKNITVANSRNPVGGESTRKFSSPGEVAYLKRLLLKRCREMDIQPPRSLGEAVATAERPMSAIGGTLSSVLQAHYDEIATISSREDAIALLDSIEPEVKNKSYLAKVRATIATQPKFRNHWNIGGYFANIILAGEGEEYRSVSPRSKQRKKDVYGESLNEEVNSNDDVTLDYYDIEGYSGPFELTIGWDEFVESVQDDVLTDMITDEEFEAHSPDGVTADPEWLDDYIKSNADEIFKRYEKKLLDKYRDIAQERANDEVADDSYPEDPRYEPEYWEEGWDWKNESLTEASGTEDEDGKPYTYTQVFDELKLETRNFTVEEDCGRYGHLSEAEHAVKILKRHYRSVELDTVGNWYQVEFRDNKRTQKTESVNPSDLTDCPECGDTSFDPKKGSCTKCSYREDLSESRSIEEDFTHYATYPYMYISNTGDEYVDMNISQEEIDKAYETSTFSDEMWLKSEACITKENDCYQVSWEGSDDYEECTTIGECKKVVQQRYPYGFRWLKCHTGKPSEEEKRISKKLSKVKEAIDSVLRNFVDVKGLTTELRETFSADQSFKAALYTGLHHRHKDININGNKNDSATLVPYTVESNSDEVPHIGIIIYHKQDKQIPERLIDSIHDIFYSYARSPHYFKYLGIDKRLGSDALIYQLCLPDDAVDKINNDLLAKHGLQLIDNNVVEAGNSGVNEGFDDDFSDEDLANIYGGDTKNDIPDGLETPDETKARLDESADLMIYLFPELTEDDRVGLLHYNLRYLGKNHGPDGSENNSVVLGTEANLRAYAEKDLGYELHPDYLYYEDDFAGDIITEEYEEEDYPYNKKPYGTYTNEGRTETIYVGNDSKGNWLWSTSDGEIGSGSFSTAEEAWDDAVEDIGSCFLRAEFHLIGE